MFQLIVTTTQAALNVGLGELRAASAWDKDAALMTLGATFIASQKVRKLHYYYEHIFA